MKKISTKFFVTSVFLFLGTLISVKADLKTNPVANFTIEGNDVTHWSENFNSGMAGWEVKKVNEEGFNWALRNDLTGSKSFKNIDPQDVASMFIEGVYAARQGEQDELLMSPTIQIPENARLKFYAAYSLGQFAVMSIKAKISIDNGSNWTEIWDAETQSTGAKAFEFRLIKIDLSSYVGKSAKIRWEYKARATTQNSASDFVLDGISIVTPGEKNQTEIEAGNQVKFYSISTGEPTSYLWEFEGASPASSTEKNPTVTYYKSGKYPVSLTVRNNSGSDKITRQNVVLVGDIAPVAQIGTPSEFKSRTSGNYFVPYKEEIQFYDRSENYPDDWSWAFTGGQVLTSQFDEKPVVFYDKAGKYNVSLTVENSKGNDGTETEVEAGFGSFVWNMNKGETATSYEQLDQNEYFPGNNTRIEAYAEYFERPAVPAFLDSLDIRFVGYQLGDDILHQIGDIQVKIHKAENGQPGEQLAWTFYANTDINADQGKPSGIWFAGDLPIIIDFPFFVVVEDIPVSNAEGLKLVMGMAPWRNYGNTAYLKKKGDDKFISADSYFGKDKQTSLWISPRLKYMILHPEKKEVKLPNNKNEQTIGVYATFEWTAESSQTWCKITRTVVEENGYLTLSCDENTGSDEREAIITLNNEGNRKTIKVVQEGGFNSIHENTANGDIKAFFDENGHLFLKQEGTIKSFSLYTIDGKRILDDDLAGANTKTYDLNYLAKGVYILNFDGDSAGSIKIIK